MIVAGEAPGASGVPSGEAATPFVRELLSGLPASCSWLLPVTDGDGAVVDFRIAAAGSRADDVGGRSGQDRVGRTMAELYPMLVGEPLWQLYHQVLADGVPGRLPDFRYTTDQRGIVATSLFDITVHRACGGLLVYWQRLDEDLRRLEQTEMLGSLGWGETDLNTGETTWSPGMYRVFERDPALGPLSRGAQAEMIVAEDRPLRETVWQILDSGTISDLTLRVRVGDEIKHLRLVADIARDPAGQPVKVYGVVQDVTARETTRNTMDRLRAQLHTQELTMLAEHRLAGRLQQIIQPVPEDVVELGCIQALVRYLPAENSVRVGGDWYHALTLPTGRVLLAIGDVVGHGLPAATAMAHLRYSLTAWTSVGIGDPAQLLRHMNTLCLQLNTTATAVVAVYDPTDGMLVWARAGHPMPLLGSAGNAGPLPWLDGLLLGASAQAEYPQGRVRLRPQDVLLLYTDGLIERRDDDGDRTLHDATSALAFLSGDAARPLTTLLPRPNPHDDTCVLAARVRC
ncbi:PP2C family protein-serine/threonine phosphatase [Catellatospora sichuanensis]|uniref:PP2C family protein-serine/threonine phosphatase n=1 Tax=Catellatospora sichuanensis TaxID=1969805 RepID=UPI001FEC3BBC|nr:PP2C family protein-serine/threonine phosphatase [Catellatospora sichuanensis]